MLPVDLHNVLDEFWTTCPQRTASAQPDSQDVSSTLRSAHGIAVVLKDDFGLYKPIVAFCVLPTSHFPPPFQGNDEVTKSKRAKHAGHH